MAWNPRESCSWPRSRRESRSWSANKELLAKIGRELFDLADAKGLDLYFEAAVGGGIPLIRPLKESLAGERVRRVLGIVNGTTNYILTRMSHDGMSFEDALAEAQRLGYAEADPTAHVGGHDAAAKCAILASIAFDARVTASDVHTEGIARVSRQDIEIARRLGYVVKLLAIAELDGDAIAVRVHPAMVPDEHPLASVRGSFNAVFIEGEKAGELMFYGRGAGGDPTAVAVVGDLVTVARHLHSGGRGPVFTRIVQRGPRQPDRAQRRSVLPAARGRGPAGRAGGDRRGARPGTTCRSEASGRRARARTHSSCS